MKILYVGGERHDGEAAAAALRGVAQNLTVSWTSRPDYAARWIPQNTDLAALIVEAGPDRTGWDEILGQARGLASCPPVIVITAGGADTRFHWPEADEILAKSRATTADLAVAVRRALDRARTHQSTQTSDAVPPAERLAPPETTAAAASTEASEARRALELERAARAGLEQQLADLRAALEQADQRFQKALATANEQTSQQLAQYEIGMARAAAKWEMVDEQLREAAVSVARSRRDQAAAEANAERLSRREAELSSLLAEATAARAAVEGRLADAEAALPAASARAADDLRAAAEQFAERRRDLEARIASEIERRNDAERAVARAASERADAETQHAAALAAAIAESRELEEALRRARQDVASQAADIDRLTTRAAELTGSLADAGARHADLERRLAATEAAFEDAAERATRERLEAARRAADREAELDARIQQERAANTSLEQAIAAANAALGDAERRHDAALASAARGRAEREAELDRELAQILAARDGLAKRLIDAEVALEQERNDHGAAAADVERLTQRAADLSSRLQTVEADRDVLARRLAEATIAIDAAVGHAQEIDGQIQQERAARTRLEQAIADAEAALRDAQQQHESALAAAARERAERQAEFDRELAQMTTAHDGLSQRLIEGKAALDRERQARQAAAADVERLTRREADLSSRLSGVETERDAVAQRFAEATTAIEQGAERERGFEDQIRHEQAARATLERTLADAEAALARVRCDAEATAGDVARLTQREAELVAQVSEIQAARDESELRLGETAERLAQTADARDALQRELEESRAAALEAERSFAEEIGAVRTRALEQAAELDLRAANDRREHELRVADMQEGNRLLALERDSLQQALAATEERLCGLAEDHREASLRFDQARTAAESDIARLTAERADLERTLETARGDFHDRVDRLSREHAAALAARDQEIGELRDRVAAVTETLHAAERRLETLQKEADRVPQLLRDLDDSRAESERLFRQAHLAMFRCARDGALIQTNRAWSTLVRRAVDEAHGADAASIFESPTDLHWLIDRCLSSKTRESIETTLRRTDGARLFVRLSASASAANVIEIAVEDLTRSRILQDRLAQAGRMEAVGRLASEVALTCGALLGDVRQHAEQWLGGDADRAGSPRQHAEAILDGATRAASHLQQLVAYSDKQTRAPAPVDLHTVVRNLVPVLKQVAGDGVDVRLPDPPSSLTLDVETERVERVLVNLAAYGRERMPFGGRLTIEVGTSIVDRQFAARYPNVRPGPHALITVTEARRPACADQLQQVRGGASRQDGRTTIGGKPAVDLGTLQGLVGECGGHLWMRVQPLGDIVAKIRLPLRTAYGQTHAPALAARGGRVRTLARWFQP